MKMLQQHLHFKSNCTTTDHAGATPAVFLQQQLCGNSSHIYQRNLSFNNNLQQLITPEQQHHLSFNRNCNKKLFTPVNNRKFRSTKNAQQLFTTVQHQQ
jgi:hypothetical protein